MLIENCRIVLVAIALLTGCVVFPVTRTYFEPNPADGTPERSASCGYHNASKDSLSREFAGLRIHVSPTYKEGKLLHVTMLFRYSEGQVKLSPENFELHGHPDGSILKPNEVKSNTYWPDKSHPYNSNWVYLTFPVASEVLENIKFVFPIGTIARNGLAVEVSPFRFQKTKKSDIYYGSINC